MKKGFVEELLGRAVFDFEKFHAKTKFRRLLKNTNSKFWPKEWKTIYYKAYLRLGEIALPRPYLSPKTSLKAALIKRSSLREFSKEKVSLGELGNLLYFSAGLSGGDRFGQRRFYPSGGARFPLEVYLISLETELPRGIYHYYVKGHTLERLSDFKKADISKITNVPFAGDAAFLIVVTAVFKRTTFKYKDRGYRHVLSESGHMAQNFYLVSGALRLGICAIGGYIDDNINKMLDVDGVEESVVYLMAGGKRKR